MILLHEKYKVITLQWLYQLNLIDLCTTQLIDVKAIAIKWFIFLTITSFKQLYVGVLHHEGIFPRAMLRASSFYKS